MEYLNVAWQWGPNAESDADAKFVPSNPCINDACERTGHLAFETNQQDPRNEENRDDFYPNLSSNVDISFIKTWKLYKTCDF